MTQFQFYMLGYLIYVTILVVQFEYYSKMPGPNKDRLNAIPISFRVFAIFGLYGWFSWAGVTFKVLMYIKASYHLLMSKFYYWRARRTHEKLIKLKDKQIQKFLADNKIIKPNP